MNKGGVRTSQPKPEIISGTASGIDKFNFGCVGKSLVSKAKCDSSFSNSAMPCTALDLASLARLWAVLQSGGEGLGPKGNLVGMMGGLMATSLVMVWP